MIDGVAAPAPLDPLDVSERLRAQLADVERLVLLDNRIEDVSIRFGEGNGAASERAYTAPKPAGKTPNAKRSTVAPSATCHLAPVDHVVIMLPHAHVTPDIALACLCFDAPPPGNRDEGCADQTEGPHAQPPQPTISIVALPCCAYVYHNTALDQPPDVDFLDARIATSARAVRVWRDVSPRFDFRASARRRGVPKRAMDLKTSNERKRGVAPPRAPR